MTVDDPGDGLPPAAEARMAEIRQQRHLGVGADGRRVHGDQEHRLRAGRAGAGRRRLQHRLHRRLRLPCLRAADTGSAAMRAFGAVPYNSMTATSGSGTLGSYAPLVRTMYEARRQAIGRMMHECQELGGHGVVGVRADASAASRPAAWSSRRSAPRCARPAGRRCAQPFTSDLTGPGLRQADHGRLGACRAGARHLDRRPARRLGDREPDVAGGRATRRSRVTPTW